MCNIISLLEDRLVKRNFKEAERKGILRIITKKPVGPSFVEIVENPRSRSAKLRVGEGSRYMRKVIKKKINLKANAKTFLSIFFVLVIALLLVHIRVLTDNLKYENRDKEKDEKELLKEKKT